MSRVFGRGAAAAGSLNEYLFVCRRSMRRPMAGNDPEYRRKTRLLLCSFLYFFITGLILRLGGDARKRMDADMVVRSVLFDQSRSVLPFGYVGPTRVPLWYTEIRRLDRFAVREHYRSFLLFLF